MNSVTEFEALFDYPLGNHQRFSIDHGPDFTSFFRAIGDAKTWVIQSGDIIIAAVSSALRTITINGHDYKVLYIGDLKVHPRYQVLGSNNTDQKFTEAKSGAKKQQNMARSKVGQYLQHLINKEADFA